MQLLKGKEMNIGEREGEWGLVEM